MPNSSAITRARGCCERAVPRVSAPPAAPGRKPWSADGVQTRNRRGSIASRSDTASSFRSLLCRGRRRAVSAARLKPGRTPERHPRGLRRAARFCSWPLRRPLRNRAAAGGFHAFVSELLTGWVDYGSAGADNIDQIAAAARAAPQIGRVLVNISRAGNAPDGELMDINRANVGVGARRYRTPSRYRDRPQGAIDARFAGTNDLEGLRRAQEAGRALRSASDDPRRPVGLADARHSRPAQPRRHRHHMYAPAPNGILDDDGRLFPDVAAARRRGVIFDLGNGGTGHLRWDVVESATRQGFWPDTLSTDWTANSRDNPQETRIDVSTDLLIS
jgi:hypothetical protein